jgi:hypothetical protein
VREFRENLVAGVLALLAGGVLVAAGLWLGAPLRDFAESFAAAQPEREAAAPVAVSRTPEPRRVALLTPPPHHIAPPHRRAPRGALPRRKAPARSAQFRTARPRDARPRAQRRGRSPQRVPAPYAAPLHVPASAAPRHVRASSAPRNVFAFSRPVKLVRPPVHFAHRAARRPSWRARPPADLVPTLARIGGDDASPQPVASRLPTPSPHGD